MISINHGTKQDLIFKHKSVFRLYLCIEHLVYTCTQYARLDSKYKTVEQPSLNDASNTNYSSRDFNISSLPQLPP